MKFIFNAPVIINIGSYRVTEASNKKESKFDGFGIFSLLIVLVKAALLFISWH
jgi:hypothetical protein